MSDKLLLFNCEFELLYFSKYNQNNTIMTVIIKHDFYQENVIKIYKYATVYLHIVFYIL